MNRYICYNRFRGESISGHMNISYGSELTADDTYIYYNNRVVCVVSSDTAHNHFVINDDDRGLERSEYTSGIINLLSVRTDKDKYQARWDKLWDDELANKYRRNDLDDYWLWNHSFYLASIPDLVHIINLIKEVK